MKNWEKDFLHREIRNEFNSGKSETEIIKSLVAYGYARQTVKNYVNAYKSKRADEQLKQKEA